MTGQTLFDKVWDQHVVADLGQGYVLLHIDRHLLHDLVGGDCIRDVLDKGYSVPNPDLCFAIPDHAISTQPGRTGGNDEMGDRLLASLRRESKGVGIPMFELGQRGQGIVHVVGPELGLSLPGLTVICGDSHTCTHGGLGALGFGVGSSEVAHALATQTLVQRKPKRMRVTFDGPLGPGVTPKDLVLALIHQIGASGGTGYAVEYAGSAIRSLGAEGRMTICNLSIELGAKIGMVAADDTTFEFLHGREFAPRGEAWDRAVSAWRQLPSDEDAVFDREVTVDAGRVRPQVTWGTSPQDVIAVDELIPDPGTEPDPTRRRAMEAALSYMGLEPRTPIAGTPIDWVFIGSCTNSRLSDLRAAAAVIQGRKVASHVRAWVVPGSEIVKQDAEREGLDRLFKEAGFEWREAGCSMCLAVNRETVPNGMRSVSTSNRNFVGRQGPGARTHLASPAMAAAAALAGAIVDVRQL